MKTRYGLLAGALIVMMGVCGQASAGSDAEQMARMKDADQWPAPGRDFALTRHSNLADINTKNIGKLQMIWLQGTNALRGHEGQPLVLKDVGGKTVLFMISGCPSMSNCNVVQALDLTDPDNPKAIWKYVKLTDRDESAVPRACCDTVNRGGSYADGKFVFATLDGFVIALDGQTGKEVWVVKHAYPEKGETITPATLIADDKVLIGFGGSEFAARGRMVAYNLKDGSEVWTCHSTGSDKDVCLTPDTNKANPHYGTYGQDLGVKTFPGEDWKIGGGTAWGWYTYDPDTKLVYYSTANPGLWSPAYRCPDKTHEECNTGAFDNKWTLSLFARKVETGEAVFAYQYTPFDQWDYDGINEKKYVTTDWAEKIDMKTGRPIKVREHSPLERGRNVSACPSAMGGKDQQPASVDPKEPNLFYVPTNNWCMELEPQERTHTNQGTVYVFANVYMYPEKQGTTGKIKKYDVLTGKTVWEIPDPYPNWSGTMVTDGGLMFYGSLGGDFRAVDRSSGKIVWSRKLGSGIIGNPITWKIGGKQYVGVYSGIGGWIGLPVTAGLDLNDKFGAIGATAMTKAANLDKIPQGGELNVFRVFE
jgi:glucose dehydrogenase